MNVSFGGLAFAGFIAAQALAVIAVHGAGLKMAITRRQSLPMIRG